MFDWALRFVNNSVEKQPLENERLVNDTDNAAKNRSDIHFDILAAHSLQQSPEYLEITEQEMPVARALFVLFWMLSPFVFRYAVYSNTINTRVDETYYAVGNATISFISQIKDGNKTINSAYDWSICESCMDLPGVTVANFAVNISGVTNPNFYQGFPSLAVFVSQDFENWYNFYSPPARSVENAFVRDMSTTVIAFNQSQGAACLGNVASTYVVACLNLFDIANTLKKGEKVETHYNYFNNKCFQVAGICGVPCVNLDNGQSPPYCKNGMIDTNLLVSNTTSVDKSDDDAPGPWAADLEFFDALILLIVFFDCLSNLLKFLPLLSGRPTEVNSGKHQHCFGTLAIGCTTPIATENSAIFLRNLLGRTATVFHTVGSRHNIRGLYVDTIMNEFRDDKTRGAEQKREKMWLAWICLLEELAKFSTNGDKIQDQTGRGDLSRPTSTSSSRSVSISSQQHSAPNTPRDGYPQHRHSYQPTQVLTITESPMAVNGSGHSTLALSVVAQHPHSNEEDRANNCCCDYQKLKDKKVERDKNKKIQTENMNALLGTVRKLRVEKNKTIEYDVRVDTVKFSGYKTSETKKHVAAPPPVPTQSVVNKTDFCYCCWRRNEIEGDVEAAPIPVAQTVQPEPINSRVDTVSTAPNQRCYNMHSILPLVMFIDAWLEVIKANDGIYDYHTNYIDALACMINDAPVDKLFAGKNREDTKRLLKQLFYIFSGSPEAVDMTVVPTSKTVADNSHSSLCRDELTQINWKIGINGCSEWDITWSYFARSKILEKESPDNVRFECTGVVPNAAVYIKPVSSSANAHEQGLDVWLAARRNLFKVQTVTKNIATIVPFPRTMTTVGDGTSTPAEVETYELAIEQLFPVEKNRGKAGALNTFLEYFRLRADQWAATELKTTKPIRMLMGVIDARHMIVKPEVFINESLPFFSRLVGTDAEPAKPFGENIQVILVQFPQYYSNVDRDDFLDNKNAGYYTLWQTLRDCAKCVTSSGTNAVWDVSHPNFVFATCSRIEDTATTQLYLEKNITIHLPCFVAYGHAKQTNDYVEAVYRWSAGAVELFWTSLFVSFADFCYIGVFSGCFAMACFWDSVFAYLFWMFIIGMHLAAAVQNKWRKSDQKRPFRILSVAATIVVNTLYWISNICSLVWVMVVPIRLAFYSMAPLSSSRTESFSWVLIALVLRLLPALLTDALTRMVQTIFPETTDTRGKWNFNMVLWRSSQLYACSFAYTFLSLVMGTISAYKAAYHEGDNTKWSSFKAKKPTAEEASCTKHKFYQLVYYTETVPYYMKMAYETCLEWLLDPFLLTKWLAASLLVLNIVCMFYSIAYTNFNDTYYLLVTIAVCGMNIFLVLDIALLLLPGLSDVIGRPVRPEYAFLLVSFVVIGTLIHHHDLPYSLMKKAGLGWY